MITERDGSSFYLSEGLWVKVVIWKSPRFAVPFLRRLFRLGRDTK